MWEFYIFIPVWTSRALQSCEVAWKNTARVQIWTICPSKLNQCGISSPRPFLKNTAHRLTCTGTKWNGIILIWQPFHRLQPVQPSDEIIQAFACSHTLQTFNPGKHYNTENFSTRTQEKCKLVLKTFLNDQHNASWLGWNSAVWGQRWTTRYSVKQMWHKSQN